MITAQFVTKRRRMSARLSIILMAQFMKRFWMKLTRLIIINLMPKLSCRLLLSAGLPV